MALAENSVAMATILDGLLETGIAEADIQTGRFTVNPVFSRPARGSDEAPKIVGTQVVNQLSVVVRNLDALGEVLELAQVRLLTHKRFAGQHTHDRLVVGTGNA